MFELRYRLYLLLLWIITYPFQATAFDTGIDNFHINGYGSLGLVYNDSDDIYYRHSIEQEGFDKGFDWTTASNLGMQLDYAFNHKLTFTTQFLLEKRPENSLNRSIESAFFSYHINDAFELNIGRMPNGVFMSSEYKNVGFANLWAHHPVEFYGQIASDKYDGVELKHHSRLADGMLTTSIWGGRSHFPYASSDGSEEVIFEPNYGVSLRWENQTWQFRVLYSQAKINDKADPVAALDEALIQASEFGWPEAASLAGFSINDTWLKYLAAGVSYDKDNWLIQSELSLVKAETSVQDKYASGYLSVGHRFGSITPYIIVSKFKTLGSREKITSAPAFIPAYQQLQAITQAASNAMYTDQGSIGIGARWDVSQRVSLKAQWDRTWIEKYGDFIFEQKNPIDKQHSFNTFSLTMDFIF